jgi:hypothetical protein
VSWCGLEAAEAEPARDVRVNSLLQAGAAGSVIAEAAEAQARAKEKLVHAARECRVLGVSRGVMAGLVSGVLLPEEERTRERARAKENEGEGRRRKERAVSKEERAVGGAVPLAYAQAVAMLPDGEQVHTFANPDGGMLLGADWDRAAVLELLREGRPELSGSAATRMGHGIVAFRPSGPVFIATRTDRPGRQ